jgi:hypothetical protein
MLIVNLTLPSLLNDLILLAREQRPKDVRLRLLARRWTEGEVNIDVSEISVTFLISDPELIENYRRAAATDD